ncbi:DUF2225 domain-containing protein [candidate division GN15 bacterium]|nr:DUF2225 domain-containing protein [candidate division GN15 bacterium]
MSCNKRITLVLAAAAWLWTAASWATSTVEIAIQCPVCGNTFTAHVVASTNNFRGQDRDFYERAAGFPPVLMHPITCTSCWYSGYHRDFDSTVHFDDATRQLLRDSLARPADYTIHEGRAMVPAWSKYELIIQTSRLLGKSWQRIQFAAMRAAWSVREIQDPVSPLGDDYWLCAANYADSMIKVIDLPSGTRACREVALARRLAPELRQLDDSVRLCATLGVVQLFRSHGENGEALETAEQVEGLIALDQFLTFYDSLLASVERERHYQKIALQILEEACAEWPDDMTPADNLYLCGEICRRLGRYADAARYFERAQSGMALSEGLSHWIREQRALVD